MSFAQNRIYFSRSRVIPVLTPSSVASGIAVSRVLFEGGLRVHEITLRNVSGLETLAALRRDLPELVVGAGTVLTPQLAEEALRAGAQFLVSPGTTEELLEFALSCDVPFVPGVSTISEMMRIQALGCDVAKVFPAEALGGTAFLESVAGPLPALKFCASGGLNGRLAAKYLALPNIIAVGGSWMAPDGLIARRKFGEIRRAAEAAAALG